MTDPIDDMRRLKAQIHANRIRFLRIELEVGNTMLDAADNSLQDDSRARRRGRAHEARDEVARQLSRGADLGLTHSEQEELTTGLARLDARLDAAR